MSFRNWPEGLLTASNGAYVLPHNSVFLQGIETDLDLRNLLAWGQTTNTFVVGNIALGRIQLGPDQGELYAGSTLVLRWGPTLIGPRISELGWDNAASLLPLIRQQNVNAANPFTMRSAGAASGNNNGTPLRLQGGRRQGTGLRGPAQMQWNADDTTFQTGVETANVVADNRVVALARGADLTSTQMPANTGDLVVYIGVAATAPTANPVSGFVLYMDPADNILKARGPAGTVTPIALP